ncbi:class A sortase [Virgibacillus proomii]|jgi:sortase A|uniref:class A sortase n=1 Tax=Virgibacillus proomii TaxID=84407 RepID=UPI000984BB71|nr:class A sortase [Virgibacillus proomii]
MSKWKKILVSILLTVGIIFLFSPAIKNAIIDGKIDKTMNRITNDLKQADLYNNRKNNNEKTEPVHDLPSELDVLKSLDYEGNPVAFLYIPSTNLQLPIYGAVNNESLLHGAAEMKDYNTLGKGNYAIAGHRMRKRGLLFHDIPRLNIGDVVYVTDKDTVYEYKVNSSEIIKEDETEVVAERGKDEITLLTCDIPSEPFNRVAVKGDLIGSFQYSDDFISNSNKK